MTNVDIGRAVEDSEYLKKQFVAFVDTLVYRFEKIFEHACTEEDTPGGNLVISACMLKIIQMKLIATAKDSHSRIARLEKESAHGLIALAGNLAAVDEILEDLFVGINAVADSFNPVSDMNFQTYAISRCLAVLRGKVEVKSDGRTEKEHVREKTA